MKTVYTLSKPVGITPLQAIQYLQKVQPEVSSIPLGYAGRLDPMAEGLVLVLAGEENKKRKEYELLEKTYQFEILFGVATDTYDVLGKRTALVPSVFVELETVTTTLNRYVGTFLQPYPPFSSARVDGKPLYYWARTGTMPEGPLPEKKVSIKKAVVHEVSHISGVEVKKEILRKLSLLHPEAGEFRQQEITEQWNSFKESGTYTVARCTVESSSGLYIRSLCNAIGETLSIPALAYSIRRTRIGDYHTTDTQVISVDPSVIAMKQ